MSAGVQHVDERTSEETRRGLARAWLTRLFPALRVSMARGQKRRELSVTRCPKNYTLLFWLAIDRSDTVVEHHSGPSPKTPRPSGSL
jgi:hypothetical protein